MMRAATSIGSESERPDQAEAAEPWRFFKISFDDCAIGIRMVNVSPLVSVAGHTTTVARTVGSYQGL